MELKSCMCALVVGVLIASARESAEAWRSPHPLEWERQAPVALLPFPQEVAWHAGALPLGGRDDWQLSGAEQAGEAVLTAWQALLSELPPGKGSEAVECRLALAEDEEFCPEAQAEGYKLHISREQGVVITAAREAGFFYALQTLRQLIAAGELPCCEVVDYPAFAVRGFHHDCGRNFQSISTLKRHIDLAARLKLNCFHWHLSDYPAYHLECKKYPQLNAPEHRTRDQGDTYSYDEVRELIAYAKARHVTIIPEIDMPGHSDYFERAFGYEMHTEEGMQTLEEIIEEICAEIPTADCPIFHFGADEINIPNAREFVERMSRKLLSLGRTPMQWEGPWDLPVGEHSIAQRWVQSKASQAADSIRQRTIDSSIGYANLLDPALLVRRWFFMQPCGSPRGDALRLGSIFCIWPDMRVADKSSIPLHNAVWPGMCAMAERSWCGSPSNGDACTAELPAPHTEPGEAFALFEQRMEAMRHTVFSGEAFPYWAESSVAWDVVEPVPLEEAAQMRSQLLDGRMEEIPMRRVYGGSLYFHTRPAAWHLGVFSHVKPGSCTWAITHIDADADGPAPFMIGFDSPARSNRHYSGVPEPGAWSQCGTRVWVNGVELPNPQVYRLAGKNGITYESFRSEDNENPLDSEEIWWAHEPTLLPLKKGRNTIIIELPYIGYHQSWESSFIPLGDNVRRKTKKD